MRCIGSTFQGTQTRPTYFGRDMIQGQKIVQDDSYCCYFETLSEGAGALPKKQTDRMLQALILKGLIWLRNDLIRPVAHERSLGHAKCLSRTCFSRQEQQTPNCRMTDCLILTDKYSGSRQLLVTSAELAISFRYLQLVTIVNRSCLWAKPSRDWAFRGISSDVLSLTRLKLLPAPGKLFGCTCFRCRGFVLAYSKV
jgi:hypothetical protein